MGTIVLRASRSHGWRGLGPGERTMQPKTIRSLKTPRRNPLVLAARKRQAGPHRDGRLKEARTQAQQEMREPMNRHMGRREGCGNE